MEKHPFDGLVVRGSKAPIGEVKNNIKVEFNDDVIEQYIPVWNTVETQKKKVMKKKIEVLQ